MVLGKAINFLVGVVTGIPMEFQFGTNWAQFCRTTGGVIGQPLPMEGVFCFFLESAFLGLLLFGEKRLSPWGHWASAFMAFLGSWRSGFFIMVTNAWMQHPVAYGVFPNGSYEVTASLGIDSVCAQHVGRSSSGGKIATATDTEIARGRVPASPCRRSPRNRV